MYFIFGYGAISFFAVMALPNGCGEFLEFSRMHVAIHYEYCIAIIESWSEESTGQVQDIGILRSAKHAVVTCLNNIANNKWKTS